MSAMHCRKGCCQKVTKSGQRAEHKMFYRNCNMAGAYTIPADLSDKEDVERLLAQIGSPDVVIFSAGVGSFDFAHETSDEAIQEHDDCQRNRTHAAHEILLPSMMDRRSGISFFSVLKREKWQHRRLLFTLHQSMRLLAIQTRFVWKWPHLISM